MTARCTHPAAFRRRKPLQILVADDNEVLRTAVRGLLQVLGHSVDVVANGRQAVDAAALQAYDVVLLDIRMPVMDGFEAARSLRLGCPRGHALRIVGLSGDHEERASYLAAGMDRFLIKPVRLADLAWALNDLGWVGSETRGPADPVGTNSGPAPPRAWFFREQRPDSDLY